MTPNEVKRIIKKHGMTEQDFCEKASIEIRTLHSYFDGGPVIRSIKKLIKFTATLIDMGMIDRMAG